jgi:hypothetical protein
MVHDTLIRHETVLLKAFPFQDLSVTDKYCTETEEFYVHKIIPIRRRQIKNVWVTLIFLLYSSIYSAESWDVAVKYASLD